MNRRRTLVLVFFLPVIFAAGAVMICFVPVPGLLEVVIMIAFAVLPVFLILLPIGIAEHGALAYWHLHNFILVFYIALFIGFLGAILSSFPESSELLEILSNRSFVAVSVVASHHLRGMVKVYCKANEEVKIKIKMVAMCLRSVPFHGHTSLVFSALIQYHRPQCHTLQPPFSI
jgi:hypothetical protein